MVMRFIISLIKLFGKNIFNSFNATKNNWSARKLTSFVFVVLIFFIHIKYITVDIVVDILIIDTCALLLLLSVITIEQIIQFKNKEKNNE